MGICTFFVVKLCNANGCMRIKYYLSGQANFWLHFTILAADEVKMVAGNWILDSWHRPFSHKYPPGQQWTLSLPGTEQQEWSGGHCPSPLAQMTTLPSAISFCGSKWSYKSIRSRSSQWRATLFKCDAAKTYLFWIEILFCLHGLSVVKGRQGHSNPPDCIHVLMTALRRLSVVLVYNHFNLLAFYQGGHSLIGYASHDLFCCR